MTIACIFSGFSGCGEQFNKIADRDNESEIAGVRRKR
jgi:hypothetical protein